MTEDRTPSPARAHPSVEKYARHVNPAFVKLLGVFGYGRVFVRGKDVWIWDHEGRRYLDALSCFGAANLGHNHPRVVARVQQQLASEALNFVHVGPSIAQGELGARLAEVTGGDLEVVSIVNTGAEAVEAGMKLARAATRRPGFVFCEGGYHGTSLGTLSIMGEPRMRKAFDPLLAQCEQVPFGDLDALRAALKHRKVAGFVVDPGLCETGLLVPPEGYLASAQALCRKYGTLMVLDEVQTGLGRTGTLFAYEAEGFVPDILTMAKSLSGGLGPIGAAITTAKIHHKAFGALDSFDLDFTTFGGNALSCAAAMETLDVLRDEGLIDNSRDLGARLLGLLKTQLEGHPLVRQIRGRGLFIAIELGPTDAGWMNRLAPGLVKTLSKTMFGQWAAVKLLERGVIVQPATQHWDTLKIVPPLTFTDAHAQQLAATIADVLGEYQGVAPLVKDVTERLGRQFMAGWAF